MLDIYEAMKRIVKAGTGDDYGDYITVMNMGIGTEHDKEKVWVTGDWNGELGGRLFKALERIGVDCEWYDEYDQCCECFKLIRVEADSYMWQPQYLSCDDGRICLECIDVTNDYVLEEFNFIDNHDKCIPDVLGKHLEEWGWAPYNGVYENGWHPGQTDDPNVILDKIKEQNPHMSVVFRLDEVSQFYIRFTAWVKERKDDVRSDD